MKQPWIAVVLAATSLAAACGNETGPVAGDLVVSATAAPTFARAVLVRVAGPVTAATAPAGSGYRVFATTSGDTTRIAIIAPSGTLLGTGPIVRLTVPDTRRAGDYTVTPVQASASTYQLITPTTFAFAVATP